MTSTFYIYSKIDASKNIKYSSNIFYFTII